MMSLATTFRYAPLLILFLAWEAATTFGLISTQMLPHLTTVIATWWELMAGGELPSQAYRSLSRSFTGLGAAVFFGILIGVSMAGSRVFRLLANPIVQAFYPMPKSALIPVVIIWFGLGDMSKISLIFLGCMLPVVISSYNGARGVNPFFIWSAKSLGASNAAVAVQVVLPGAMPEILNGVRTALAFSFILMVSSELVIARDGLGYLISTFGESGSYPAMFAVILTVATLGFVADRTYSAFMRYVLRWRES